jgi:hypothetical protein
MIDRSPRRPWRALAVLGLILAAAATTFAQDDAAEKRLKKDITYLASEECEGRGIDTKGIHKAADYIANEFKAAGLKPGGKDGSWFQPFTVNAGGGKDTTTITLHGPQGQVIELAVNKDFKVLPMSGSGQVKAPVVFAGYGLTAPDANYDDYKGLDAAGKVVVVLRRTPRWNNQFAPFGGNQDKYQGYEAKFAAAEQNKAAAVLLVNDRSEGVTGDAFIAAFADAPVGIPVAQLRRNVLDAMFISAKGMTVADVEKDIDRDLKPRSGPVTGWTASLTVKRTTYACKNIIGVLEGAGPLANETVVIGAHYDHLGFGGQGSLAKEKGKKQIHPGADDNGSGTTMVMELARRFGAMKDRQGRRLVFMLFSGEERGLLGSAYYCRNPLFPLENTAVMFNLDMVGRLNDKNELTAEGFDTGKGMKELLDQLNGHFGFKLKPDKSIYARSDQYSFYQKKIPALFFFSGFHDQYHRPTDTADLINIAGMAKIAAMSEKIIHHLAVSERPKFLQPEPTGGKGPKGGVLVKLQVAFDGTDTSGKGMLVEVVTADGPAAKGGIKPGDRITALGAAQTPNLAAYTAALRQQKANQPVEVTVLRDGKELKLTVTPAQ